MKRISREFLEILFTQSKGSLVKKFYISYPEKAKAFSLLFVSLPKQ